MAAKTKQAKKSQKEEALAAGLALIGRHPLFSQMKSFCTLEIRNGRDMGKNCAAYVQYVRRKYVFRDSKWSGAIALNRDFPLSPEEWAYTIAHCGLHLAFGHFDAEKMPGYERLLPDGGKAWQVSCDIRLWNEACDIYVSKFLSDIKFGRPTCRLPIAAWQGSAADERGIYAQLLAQGHETKEFRFGTASPGNMDMRGLESPAVYDAAQNERNECSAGFALALAHSVSDVVREAGGHAATGRKLTASERAAAWFVNHYPLLGGLAAGFKVIEDYGACRMLGISVAAVNVASAEIYVNPVAGLSGKELRFVLAHEYLHAGLQHHARRQGRDPYLWNVACDFVINGWLLEMGIGKMPERGELYDETLRGLSAEEIYDRLLADMRQLARLETFRGRGKGDILDNGWDGRGAASLDDFYRDALANGLEYHAQNNRGYIPAGLIEEIRALSMPPIPWDVALGHWFDLCFSPLAARRTYARPSRRQGSTPDIPRPRYVADSGLAQNRTFGVVLDTSGSMSAKLIGCALGAIASYAAAKDVPYARVVFCDAAAYDAGWLAPEDVAGRVEVKGRGGTVLQPGIDLLREAKDFPKDAPILIITDGDIEPSLAVPREHAFLIPEGAKLPFRAAGKVFRFKDKT